MIDVVVRRRQGPLDLHARLTAEPGDVVALVGPNGAGKSTLLHALAQQLDDVGLVFQDRLLFPHMSALDNVAFGLRRQGLPRKEARAQAARWLDDLGLAEVAHHRPGQLSGGQAQRVALARALARQPTVLLLDEPFAGVDVAARSDVRRAVRQAAGDPGRITVLVTHEPVDVLSLATKVVVLEDGRVTQEGSVDDVRTRPRSAWTARMAGVNLLPAGRLATTGGRGEFAVVHPRHVTLSVGRPVTSARNVWPGRVTDIDHEGDRVRVRLAGDEVDLVSEITPAALADLRLAVGHAVWASVKASEVEVFD